MFLRGEIPESVWFIYVSNDLWFYFSSSIAINLQFDLMKYVAANFSAFLKLVLKR